MAHIGDFVPKTGIYTEPGVVTEKKGDGTVVVDTEPLQINKFHRYSNTTGLNSQEKEEFNAILDEIFKHDDRVQRLNEIQNEIDRLRTDPQKRNIVQYLKNQQTTMIREARKLPRFYSADESQLKT